MPSGQRPPPLLPTVTLQPLLPSFVASASVPWCVVAKLPAIPGPPVQLILPAADEAQGLSAAGICISCSLARSAQLCRPASSPTSPPGGCRSRCNGEFDAALSALLGTRRLDIVALDVGRPGSHRRGRQLVTVPVQSSFPAGPPDARSPLPLSTPLSDESPAESWSSSRSLSVDLERERLSWCLSRDCFSVVEQRADRAWLSPCPPPMPLPSRLCTGGGCGGDLRSCALAGAESERRRDRDRLELRSLERERPSPCRSRSRDRGRSRDLERRRRLDRLEGRDRRCSRSLDRLIPRR